MAAFTTIAAIGSAALSTGMSFAQASKQRKLQQEAEAEAQKAFDEAKKTLDVNYLESLGIAKEPYELERESLLQAGAQALQAGVEGETRGAAATAGRVLMAQQEQAAQQRAAMSRGIKITRSKSRIVIRRSSGPAAKSSTGSRNETSCFRSSSEWIV